MKKPSSKKSANTQNRITPELREAIAKSDRSLSRRAAAEKFGVSPSAIAYWRDSVKMAEAPSRTRAARQSIVIDDKPAAGTQMVCIMGSAEQIRQFLAQR